MNKNKTARDFYDQEAQNYKKMYESMKDSVLKQKIGRLIRELEDESKSD